MNQPQDEVNETNAAIVCYCGLFEPFHDFTAVEHQPGNQVLWNLDDVELCPVAVQEDERKLCRELLEGVNGKPVLSDRFLDYLFEDPLSRFPGEWADKKVLWPAKRYFDPKGREYVRYSFFVADAWGWYLLSIDSEIGNEWFVATRKVPL